MTVTEQEQVQEQEQGEPEAEAEGEPKAKRAKTQYAGRDFEPQILDELPTEEPVGRSRLYFDLLNAQANDGDALGRWKELARFGTANGAKSVASTMNKQVQGKLTEKEIEQGVEREIPMYEGYQWEFDSRKVVNPENPDPTHRDSVLYARLVPVEQEQVQEQATA